MVHLTPSVVDKGKLLRPASKSLYGDNSNKRDYDVVSFWDVPDWSLTCHLPPGRPSNRSIAGI